MKREEERIISEAKNRKKREEEDMMLALKLQEEYNEVSERETGISLQHQGHSPGSNASNNTAVMVVVKVPPNHRGGQRVDVALPNNRGIAKVVIPQGLRPGDEFQFRYDPALASESTSNHESDEEDEIDPEALEEFLKELPEDVRKEILAQETAQLRNMLKFEKSKEAPKSVPKPASISNAEQLFQVTIPPGVYPGGSVSFIDSFFIISN